MGTLFADGRYFESPIGIGGAGGIPRLVVTEGVRFLVAVAGDLVAVAGDWVAVAGDWVTVAGDWVAVAGDWVAVAGD